VSDLDRFVAAQDAVYPQVLAELGRGRKTSHWMWFVFPQIAGLGESAMSQHYAIADADEARAYLAHPILGARLRECTQTVLAIHGKTAEQIFGGIDAMKFRSSLTLFASVAGQGDDEFRQALEQYFSGASDQRTLTLLGSGTGSGTT
jgi:uncharacterized protein (DUF1810 family)